ncbi:CHASE domain-containing protein [uncultured Roseobacter sp.]|uniref:CHASE domain-containing protein n=1 Tax=uncultured Roseobacter sp. TaxID=114847 RepID=UPI002630A7AF|nr:CHASE domain-containing protein [uncultured Roseobacter sp.]
MPADNPIGQIPGVVPQFPPETVEKERRAIERLGRLRFVHWIAILVSVLLTVLVWQYSKRQIELRTEVRFNVAADHVAELIEERLQKYELALWAGVSAIHTHGGEVDLAKWREFSENLEIELRYPGINGIGVIHEIRQPELQEYLSEQRLSRPGFTVHPPREGEVYQPITFIEPEDINFEAIGLDMMHEVNRRTTLEMARDTASAQITGPIVLVQDESRTPGFLFFAPFYQNRDSNIQEERAENFDGAVYAPFVVRRLMQGVLDKDRRDTSVRISDGDQVIYDEISTQDADYDRNSLGQKQIIMPLYGRQWTLDVRAGLGFRQDNSGFESTAILVAGIGIDFALLALFILLSRANRRGLRFAEMATEALEAANRDLDRARRDAESVSDMKSAFLSTMSHEVRTPLTAISGILELLERAGLSGKQAMLVDTGRKASDKLIKLLTDVLETSRLEANALELWEREVSVPSLIEEWQRLAEGLIDQMEKDVEIRTVIEDGAPEVMRVDDIRLSQVINNLLDNATRFTKAGTITIRTFKPEAAGDTARTGFSVSDTGRGIGEGDLELIFERFRQVDNSFTRETSGAGLGLTICNELVSLMGGTISVSSEVGAGTTFEIKLPVNGVLPHDSTAL